MRTDHSSLPLHDPLGVALSHYVLDDGFSFDALIARHHFLSLVFSLLVATNIIPDTIEAKAMNATLLPVNLGWNLCHLLIKVIEIVVF